MACPLADLVLAIRAVNVDVALLRVRVPSLGAFQPEDAREDQISIGHIVWAPLPDRHARLENREFISPSSMLFHDAKPTQRRAIGPLLKTNPKLRSAARPLLHQTVPFPETQCLVCDGDFDAGALHIHCVEQCCHALVSSR